MGPSCRPGQRLRPGARAVIVGPTLLGSGTVSAPPVALASNNGVGTTSSSGPEITPVVVDSTVTWVVTKGPSGLSLVTANVKKVCPTGDEPDCAPLAGISRGLASLPTVPSSLVLSPSNGSQAVAIGPTPNTAGMSLYVLTVPALPSTSPAPSSAPGASPAASPTPAASPSSKPAVSPSVRPSGSPAAASPNPSPVATPPPVKASPQPSPSAVTASPSPAVNPPVQGSPAPSAAAALAILSNVTLVGDEAAYSGDGQWFAFSARPAGSSIGPDVYVWQAGWPAAKPITADHATVFSGWVDGRILASRAVPIVVDASPSPASSDSPQPSAAASPSDAPSPSPAAPSPSTSPAAQGAGPGAAASLASPAGSPAPALLAQPAAYLIDPTSGVASRINGLDGWRPVVDPSGRWVAYWAGTLVFDPVNGVWQPFEGGLQVASWTTVSAAPDSTTGAAAAHALPLTGVTDWDVRWDQTGDHLGVWVADTDNPGLGRLSLLTIDQASGAASSAAPELLPATPALRGFGLKDGQLVWATPPGQDGLGSHLSVLAWTGVNAGKTSVQAIDNGTLIVVP